MISCCHTYLQARSRTHQLGKVVESSIPTEWTSGNAEQKSYKERFYFRVYGVFLYLPLVFSFFHSCLMKCLAPHCIDNPPLTKSAPFNYQEGKHLLGQPHLKIITPQSSVDRGLTPARPSSEGLHSQADIWGSQCSQESNSKGKQQLQAKMVKAKQNKPLGRKQRESCRFQCSF